MEAAESLLFGSTENAFSDRKFSFSAQILNFFW